MALSMANCWYSDQQNMPKYQGHHLGLILALPSVTDTANNTQPLGRGGREHLSSIALHR